MSSESPARRALVKRAMEIANRNDPRLELSPGEDAWDDEHRLAGLFNDLSHRPELLHSLLDAVPDGAEVAERVLWLRSIAGSGRVEPSGGWDFYMVVRAPSGLPAEPADALVRKHYAAVAALLDELGDPDLGARLRCDVPVVRGPQPSMDSWRETLEGDLYESLGELLRFEQYDDALFAMHEAAYKIAASYDLARWVLWPAYRRVIESPDPFRPSVDLWAAGIETQHRGDSIAVWDAPR